MTTFPESSDEGRPLQLRDYVSVLSRRKWSVVLPTVLVLAAALVFSLKAPVMYTATAEVVVRPLITSAEQQAPAGSLVSIDTERKLAASTVVANTASGRLPYYVPTSVLLNHVSVTAPTNTQVLRFDYSDANPRRARDGAQAFAEAYLAYKTQQADETIKRQRQPLRDRIAELRRQLLRLDGIIAGESRITPGQQSQHDDLTAQIAVLQSQLAPLEALVVDPGQIIEPAQIPTAQSSPKTLLNLAVGVFVGLALGLGFALTRERLDDRLRGPADVDLRAGPVLGVIPKQPNAKGREDGPTIAALELPHSQIAESFRGVRASLLALSTRPRAKIILITSPLPGEGKSTATANLGVLLAQANKRVVLIDADFRTSTLGHMFAVDGSLSEPLGSAEEGGEASGGVVRLPVDQLSFMPKASLPSKDAEMFEATPMRDILNRLAKEYDYVLIDTPAALTVADAVALAPLTDAVLIVVNPNSTRTSLSETRRRLDQVGARLLGSIFNEVDRGSWR